MSDWAGLQVVRVSYAGVGEDLLKPLPTQLAQQAGTPLDPDKVRESLRSLYATGLYNTIEVLGVRAGNDVSITFSGTPRLFVGRVNVAGVKDDRLDAVLDNATQLQSGTAYSESRVAAAQPEISAALQNNGFYRGQINQTKVLDRENSLVDLNFYTTTGPQARIGDVELTGDSGVTEVQFRKEGKLKRNRKVNRNTVSRALSSLRKHYNKRERLAATVSLTSKEYVPPSNRLNYTFLAHQGPIVQVRVDGAKISRGTLQKLVPVYEEGTIDQDLLNEGAQNLRNYYESHGYFDVKVSHAPSAHRCSASDRALHRRSREAARGGLGLDHRQQILRHPPDYRTPQRAAQQFPRSLRRLQPATRGSGRCQHQGALFKQRLQCRHGHTQIYRHRYRYRETAKDFPLQNRICRSTKAPSAASVSTISTEQPRSN